MTTVNEIKEAIEALPENDYVRLRDWFLEKDWKSWDKQIEMEVKSGELDFLTKEAIEEKKRGKLKDL